MNEIVLNTIGLLRSKFEKQLPKSVTQQRNILLSKVNITFSNKGINIYHITFDEYHFDISIAYKHKAIITIPEDFNDSVLRKAYEELKSFVLVDTELEELKKQRELIDKRIKEKENEQ